MLSNITGQVVQVNTFLKLFNYFFQTIKPEYLHDFLSQPMSPNITKWNLKVNIFLMLFSDFFTLKYTHFSVALPIYQKV